MEIAFALKRLDCLQEHRLSRASTPGQKPVQSAERRRTDVAIDRDVGIVARTAIERVERTLQEGAGNFRPHVHAGVKQLGRDSRRAPGNGIEAGTAPVEPLINVRGGNARQAPHRAAISMRPRNGFGDAERRRSAAIGGMIDITAFALNKFIEEGRNVHWSLLICDSEDNQNG